MSAVTEKFDLSGKIAVVTGASEGLGARFAQVLAKAGAKVAVAARRLDKLEDLAKEIRENGGVAQAYTMDVTDPDSVKTALGEIHAGLGPIDILINNAGVAEGIVPFHEGTEEAFNWVIDTNLKGAWRVAREVTARMVDQKRPGVVINISSIMAFGNMYGGTPYAASKAAIQAMTRNMALDLGEHNIRVNAICPGFFNTELNKGFFETEEGKTWLEKVPMKRIGVNGELDGPLLLLASDAGAYMTGSSIVVDGGHLLRAL